jgi:hypothetical protein
VGLTQADKAETSEAASAALLATGHETDSHSEMDNDAADFDPFWGSECANSPEIARPTVKFLYGNGRITYAALTVEAKSDGGKVACSGLMHSFLVLRKRDNRWKVLLLKQGVSLAQAVSMADNLDRLGLSPGKRVAPAAPVLLAPYDGEPQTLFPKQDISWQQTATRPAAYLVESQYGNPRGDVEHWSAPAITFVNPIQYGNVVRMPMPFGSGMQPHRWRVWAVGKDGQVALSEWRTVQFTN